jgi:hypothetical protein
MAKAKKKRAEKYNEKLAIDGSFEDVINTSVSNINMENKQANPDDGLSEKERLFKNEREKLEQKYADVLKGKKLTDHYYSFNNNDTQFGLNWNPDSDLPSDIRDEVRNIAQNIWGQNATIK